MLCVGGVMYGVNECGRKRARPVDFGASLNELGNNNDTLQDEPTNQKNVSAVIRNNPRNEDPNNIVLNEESVWYNLQDECGWIFYLVL